MPAGKKSLILPLATLVGTIIGVGLFGLPYVGSKAGFPVLFFYLTLLAGLAIVIHLFFGEVAAKTKGLHRLPGYAEIYFGPSAKRAAFILQLLSLLGALLAYLIVGGSFLAALFSGSVYLYTFIFFLFGAFFIWRGARSVSVIEFILLCIFFVIIVVLFAGGIGKVIPSHLSPPINLAYFFLPYGIILFALWGTSVVPEIKEQVGGDLMKLQRVIVSGIVLCLVLYLLFSLVVIGVTGTDTTKDAIAGLQGHLGQWVVTIGYLAGIIAAFTSFITLGMTLEKTFRYDYHLPKVFSWLIACCLPIILYIIGLKDFIDVVSLTGAVMLGLEAVLIVLMYLKIKKMETHRHYRRYRLLGIVIMVLLLAGVVLEIFYFIRGY